ncbi:fucose isomerase [bacterium]|nr:fucose isomerase [bacterium]
MVTLGVVVGNRGFFPSHLAESGRKTILDVLRSQNIKAICLAEEESELGVVSVDSDARKCADLFKRHRDEIDGILITLPNFGEEKPIANTIRWSGLNVPVLVHAFPDNPARMAASDRRDSFCGKMSCCNNLRQYGIKYTITSVHTMDPEGDDFKTDLGKFASVCRIVKMLRGARLGQIGARPAAFNTVRYSEKILERSGISVETLDLSDLLGWSGKLKDEDANVKSKLEEIRQYTQTASIPTDSLTRMAKLGVSIDKWMSDTGLDATAIQCWTAMEEFYGVVPCTLMSMMSNKCVPSACEADIPGLIGMLALQSASERPAALLDWNNNYGDDPDKCVFFHCSNLPKDVFAEHEMDFQAIIAGSVGQENAYGTIVGRIQTGPFTYCRVSTDDLNGRVVVYAGEGRFTDDALDTFGGYGVAEIPNFQDLLAFICESGLEHHVAMTRGEVVDPVVEALHEYMDWEVYLHI